MDEKLTPMMKQYGDIKRRYPDDILFFRMGDFYEMFLDDAKIASKILDIALTSRQNDIPMCGIPYHAAESYIARLIKAGMRVAVCEQLESVPSSGNIVRRDVVRIITPGTVIEPNLLASDDNNFLCSIYITGTEMGMAFIDISTGDFFYFTSGRDTERFRSEIIKFAPGEIIIHVTAQDATELYTEYIKNRGIPLRSINEWDYDPGFMTNVICSTFQIHNLKGLGIETDSEIITAGSILRYINETHKTIPGHLKHPVRISSAETMMLDDATISNLEIIENQQDGSKNRTIFSVLNHAKTAMGKRTLERELLHPLVDVKKITVRLDMVDFMYSKPELIEEISAHLKDILDMERLIARFTMGKIQPRNFIALKQSISAAGRVKAILYSNTQGNPPLAKICNDMPDLEAIEKKIAAIIDDDPALSPEQGRTIRPGYMAELDHLYELKSSANKWMLNFQEGEKARLGISTLRVRYNRILGYYIEISKGQAANAPREYFRKQTLVGAERFTTEELQKFEADILGASDKIIEIEKTLLDNLRGDVIERNSDIQITAGLIGYLDFLCSLASAAIFNRFVKPSINVENRLSIKSGRHPVVEKYYTKEIFISNDVLLDDEKNIINIITGPNMSGKSTYIRMCAVIQLMAQAGSFVPAESADLSLTDRIFTRIGASDNISSGESTFLVEMNETANILNNATDKSLIIMDEVGRGTSTYDGLSIAWAVVEYILRYIRAKTLFATHYHELTQLGNREGIVNYNVFVKETMNNIEFLHKVIPGSADRSYGIHVAKLAGLPKNIISRSMRILERLESRNSDRNRFSEEGSSSEQLEIFNASNHLVIQTLKKIDTDNITPLEALNEINKLKKLID